MSRLAFHRPARMLLPQLPSQQVTLPNPPEPPKENPANNAWTLLLPLLSSVGMAAYMVTFGKPALIIIGVLFFLTSTGAVIGMRMSQRSTNGRQARKARTRYRRHLALARDEAREVATAQRTVTMLADPDPHRLWSISTNRHRVWERRQSDEDFLRVRIGHGAVRLATPLGLDPNMDPLGDYDWESLQAAHRLIDRMGHVAAQPMIIDVGRAGVLSVVGSPPQTDTLARAMLTQIGVLHAPDDVTIAVETSGAEQWEWTKWLPHTFEPDARGESGTVSLVAEDPEVLGAFLAGELAKRNEQQISRRNMLSGERSDDARQRRLVVLFTGFAPFSEWGRSELMKALLQAAGHQLGITLVFLSQREQDEPSRVDLRIRFDHEGHIVSEGNLAAVVTPAHRCRPDEVTPQLAELIARNLAPLRLSDEREQVLTRTRSLSEMVLGSDPGRADVTSRWVKAGDPRMLRAPIGTDGDGQTVMLDIKESGQGGSGPHGLIVGATGSGKSELLRTLVTGLALTHSPELLSFVLIDFKGGAAFAPLRDLPHVSGLITNLADDAAMIDRVLAALMGEQQRRQHILRDAGNIDTVREYQIRRAAGAVGADGEPLEPLPTLLIVVDEFSELLSGRPEFADLFVQIGRVGRSLGMHLLMATQRLEEGRLRGLDSHLSYRICLRTFSAAESRTVIGTTDAYKLPSIPGSAYLKVDESIYQRFRVAHVSAPYVSPEERLAGMGAGDTTIAPFDLRSDAVVVGRESDEFAELAARPGPTELQIVAERLHSIASPAHQVWLPPLPAALALDHLVGRPTPKTGRGYAARLWPLSGRLAVPIGLIDLPLKQDQETLVMDFAGVHGHLAAVGAPRTGRSTFLRTVMMSGMLTHTPDELQFYCIDFGGGTLHPYASAPHVGVVAGRNDPELVNRTFAEIRTLIVRRERQMRELGVESIAELRERRQAGLLPAGLRAADVFLMIDNWGALRAEFENAEAYVTEIAARGLGAGVHLVMTSGRWNDIRPALRDSIGTRIELRLNDPTESDVHRRLAARIPSNMAGRGISAPGVFFQLVLPRLDGNDSADGLREAQEEALAKVTEHWTGPAAPPIRLLPQRVLVSELPQLPGEAVPIGLAEHDLSAVGLDLQGSDPHFLVYGDAGSGKSSLLRTWLSGLVERTSPYDVRVVLIDYRHTLMGAVPEEHLGAYAGDAGTAQVYVQQVVEKLKERVPPPGITPAQLKARDWWEGTEIYVVVDDYDLIVGPQSVLAPLLPFVPQAREVGLHLVLARRVAGMVRSGMSDTLTTRIRDMGCGGLILSGDPKEGIVLGDERAAQRPPGRGVLVRRGQPNRLIQTALTETTQG
ncbi:type VII secretion protein EccCa [Micromonospora sp. R77]|uniref:type VII secretion protein EccCa n=1 Tax=Micromonospora sp. R77 TaxID=2925836 RepID=UPI001F61040B|nr:type VII secretion protein EccCa [Micromonospora sp. R77]MCI4061399.1 type VII secretion protein EccCa [Micromonospora sp. R77]